MDLEEIDDTGVVAVDNLAALVARDQVQRQAAENGWGLMSRGNRTALWLRTNRLPQSILEVIFARSSASLSWSAINVWVVRQRSEMGR